MPLLPPSSLRLLGLVTACATLAACSTWSDVAARKDALVTAVSPYKIDIIQGNVVTREQLNYLRPGMPRAQVRDVLGSALLTSVFHADRWDYVFTLQRQGAQPQSRKVTVFFKDNVLDHVEADEVPSETEFVSTLRSKLPTGPAPALEASPEVLQAARSAKPAATTSAPPPAPAGADATAYPPLEPAQ